MVKIIIIIIIIIIVFPFFLFIFLCFHFLHHFFFFFFFIFIFFFCFSMITRSQRLFTTCERSIRLVRRSRASRCTKKGSIRSRKEELVILSLHGLPALMNITHLPPLPLLTHLPPPPPLLIPPISSLLSFLISMPPSLMFPYLYMTPLSFSASLHSLNLTGLLMLIRMY